MDELAAAAAVVTLAAEDYAGEEMELDVTAGTSAGRDDATSSVESSFADKENEGDLPVHSGHGGILRFRFR